MPRFFFNTNDDVELWDEEGTELTDIDAARRAAIRYVGELLRECPRLDFDGTWQLKASDACDTVLFTIDVRVTPTRALVPMPGFEAAHRRPTIPRQPETIERST